jgi:hypothetical protein
MDNSYEDGSNINEDMYSPSHRSPAVALFAHYYQWYTQYFQGKTLRSPGLTVAEGPNLTRPTNHRQKSLSPATTTRHYLPVSYFGPRPGIALRDESWSRPGPEHGKAFSLVHATPAPIYPSGP